MTRPIPAEDEKRQFNVLLPASVIREIKLASIDRGVSLSALVEQAVRAYLGKDDR
jgi:hypothetical protein